MLSYTQKLCSPELDDIIAQLTARCKPRAALDASARAAYNARVCYPDATEGYHLTTYVMMLQLAPARTLRRLPILNVGAAPK